ncbi:MAG: hypothetical protein Q8S18_13160 [Bacteroidales bacterium]|nr:hypothetical protein [Bacteroidales bacterium]
MNKLIKQQVKIEIDRLCLECMNMFIKAYQIVYSTNIFQDSWDEDDYTAHLTCYLEDIRKENQWFIAPQKPHFSDSHYWGKTKAKKAPRPDLYFEKYLTFSSKEIFNFTIEAKIIKHDDSDLKGRYIDTGIDNFISERYPKGCIAAYVVKGTENDCANSINSLLIKRNRGNEKLTKQLFLEKFEFTYSSVHENGSNIIELKHLFLNFITNKN